MKKGIILHASSRSHGNTRRVADHVAALSGFDLIDLTEKEIGRFDYEFRNAGDDYLPLMRRLIERYDTFVFATPVYWYSMSGLMKDFFDRFTDLLRSEKDTGRMLRGKQMAMISCSSGPSRPDYFAAPFKDTAGYLGMSYLGDLHGWIENDEIPEAVREAADEFVRSLNNSS